jgi:hypothetical protein
MFLQSGLKRGAASPAQSIENSLLEKSIRGRFDRAFSRHVGFEPRDLLFKKRNALGELGGGQEREILTDLMSDLLFRPVIFIDSGHAPLLLHEVILSRLDPGCHIGGGRINSVAD